MTKGFRALEFDQGGNRLYCGESREHFTSTSRYEAAVAHRRGRYLNVRG